MSSINGKQSHESMNERRQLVGEQLVCISECDLIDQVCRTRCVWTSSAWGVIKRRLTNVDVMLKSKTFD